MAVRMHASLVCVTARVDGASPTSIAIVCDGCGALLRTRLEAEPAFLFPSVRL